MSRNRLLCSQIISTHTHAELMKKEEKRNHKTFSLVIATSVTSAKSLASYN